MTTTQNLNDILTRNILELGIVPINLNMLKKDVGMINISLYS